MHWRRSSQDSLYKNKRILRSVDQAIAEQGRWSVFGHLIIFAVVEWLMGFRAIPVVISYSFAIVLLSVALARLFYLIQFNEQYGRGPARWRQHYGLLTLLGATLWSAYLTLTIVHPGYTSSLTFVWIYTAAVVASHIFIFAAYRSMAQWYNGILLIPPGIAGIAMLQWEMVTLGIALLLFFAFMELTSRQVSARFWDTQRSRQRLELTLGETSAAEHQAAMQAEANQHSLVQLIHMIRQPLERLIGQAQQQSIGLNDGAMTNTMSVSQQALNLTALTDQFELYVRIRSHELETVQKVFSINRVIEQSLLEVEPVASSYGLDLSCAIHPEVPERIIGQSQAMQYLLHQSLLFTLGLARGEEVVIKLQTDQDAQNLVVKVRFLGHMDDSMWQQCQTLIRSNQTIESFPQYDQTLLSLAICALLVRQQNGKLALSKTSIEDLPIELVYRIPMEISSQSERRFQADKVLADQRIWIYGFPQYGAQFLKAELQNWGLLVTNLTELDPLAEMTDFDFGLFNVTPQNPIPPNLLAQAETLTQLGIAALCSSTYPLPESCRDERFTLIRKPWLRRSLHRWLAHQLKEPNSFEMNESALARLIQARLLVISSDADLYSQLRGWLQPMGAHLESYSEVQLAVNLLQDHDYDMIMIDIDLSAGLAFDVLSNIRQHERDQQLDPVPVLTFMSSVNHSIEVSRVFSNVEELNKPLQRTQLLELIERFWGS